MRRLRYGLPLLFLLALAGASGSAKADTPSGRQPNEPVDLPESDADKAELASTICQCVAELGNAGQEITGAKLLACAVDRFWPTTEFPPIAADPQSVKDAYAMTAMYVQAYLDDPDAFVAQWCGPDITEPTPAEPQDPGQGPLIPGTTDQGPLIPAEPASPPVTFDEHGATKPGYPWEVPAIHKGSDGKHAPTPGMFYIVKKSNAVAGLDSMLEIARYALGSAYAMAGNPIALGSIPDEEVLAYLALIVCSPWNDAAYGTNNDQATGGTLGLGPHGRGINMYARHHSNLTALVQGKKPTRTTLLNGAEDDLVDVSKGQWPQLWLPPINLEALINFGAVTTQGLEWSNGDSVLVPPPAAWAHGVYSRVAPSGSGFWGC